MAPVSFLGWIFGALVGETAGAALGAVFAPIGRRFSNWCRATPGPLPALLSLSLGAGGCLGAYWLIATPTLGGWSATLGLLLGAAVVAGTLLALIRWLRIREAVAEEFKR